MNIEKIDFQKIFFKSYKKIILIGLPCSGKSYIGKHLSNHLSELHLDTDELFELYYKIKPNDFIKKYGMKKFRINESKIFIKALKSYDYIISTGGGIVEYEYNREILNYIKNNTNSIIIYIKTSLDLIKKRYNNRCSNFDEMECIKKSKSIDILYNNRNKFYEEVSNYKYICTTDNEIQNFIKFINNINEKYVILPNSFFVCMKYNDIKHNWGNLKQITNNCNALEIRIDYCLNIQTQLLDNTIENTISKIKKIIDIPLILTIRSKQEWGYFIYSNELLEKLINLFLKLGVRFIDHELRNDLIIDNRMNTNIIGSCHTKDFNYLKKNIISGFKKHKPDILKVVVSNDIYKKTSEFLSLFESKKILISIGNEGRLSRVKNLYLTPIKSNLIDETFPGQITYEDIINNPEYKPYEEYYLFGIDIKKSPSKFIHNYAFKKTNLNNKIYNKFETKYIQKIFNILNRPNFKGGSITMPYKEKLYEYIKSNRNNILSDDVKKIGSLNTIIKDSDGILIGENTDWLAIRDTINKFKEKFELAYVIGNGGTAKSVCYTLNKLNIPCIVYCRNKNKALKKLKNMKILKFIENLNIESYINKEGNEKYPPILIINCIPPDIKINYNNLKNKYYLINMGYLKKDDNIINKVDDSEHQPYKLINGYEILCIQAQYQYKLFIGAGLSPARGWRPHRGLTGIEDSPTLGCHHKSKEKLNIKPSNTIINLYNEAINLY